MKQFQVPDFYRSPIISRVKAKRKLEDPRKKDFSALELTLNRITFIFARHFGFCYGVENAIERSYKAIEENPNKRIFLVSEMIHNPNVNEDLLANGVQFIQDINGRQLIPFDSLTKEDIVIIPAFGTTIEIENILKEIGVNIETYNTTCPFVEKVWNRSKKLGETEHTIVIHGKLNHEETRATFSHSQKNAPSIIVENMRDAEELAKFINGTKNENSFFEYFNDKISTRFDPNLHLEKIGVINQTTMLASETEKITDYLRSVMENKYGKEAIKSHIADTRDTLCYATNDNQSATYGLLEKEADLAIVIGGHNSSNTTHLVELLESKFTTFFISNQDAIYSKNELLSFDIHTQELKKKKEFLPEKDSIRVIITSGASCPDSIVDEVLQKILLLVGEETINLEQSLENLN
jgi:4-hydroxy-3-methylbut-2-en-1-yl diphosphate reductase